MCGWGLGWIEKSWMSNLSADLNSRNFKIALGEQKKQNFYDLSRQCLLGTSSFAIFPGFQSKLWTKLARNHTQKTRLAFQTKPATFQTELNQNAPH